MMNKETIGKWEEFRETGLFWFINTILHMFGYAIKIKVEDGIITDVYPDRVKYRGFPVASNTNGYYKVSKFMSEHANELLDESKDDSCK